MCRLHDRNKMHIKIELKHRLLEPKWHWSVRYCCNFLCAKHGYKQIKRKARTKNFKIILPYFDKNKMT